MSTKSIDEEVKIVVNNLNEFKEELENMDYSHQREKFFDTIKKLDKYVTSIVDEKIYRSFYHSKYFKYFYDFFLEPHQYYMRAIEALESSHIQRTQFRDNTPLEDKVAGEFMKARFHTKVNDLNMVDFSNLNRIVMVGAGPLPETILFITQNFPNIKEIIGIDNNAEAVFAGSELIRFLGMSNATIKNANGLAFDYSGADLVYIANFVPPKNKVLNQVAKTAPEHVQIIIESPVLMGRLFFEEVIPEKLNNLLRITDQRINETEYFRHNVLKIEKHPDILI